jgi:hypothetical protein
MPVSFGIPLAQKNVLVSIVFQFIFVHRGGLFRNLMEMAQPADKTEDIEVLKVIMRLFTEHRLFVGKNGSLFVMLYQQDSQE